MTTNTLNTLNSQATRTVLLWIVFLQLVLTYAPTIAWLFQRWTLSVWHHGHGVLIVLVVVYLVWTELKNHRELESGASPWGFAILIPGLAIHMLDTGIHSQILSAFSLFLILPGLSLLFMGTVRTQAIIFPLLILFLTLPIPLFLTESIHLRLRHITTVGTAHLLPFLGIPVFSQGTLLQISNGALQVADACSGFSTLYAAVTIACLVAYYCPDNRHRLIIMLVSAPLAIVVNIMRITILCLLVNWRGTDILKTSAHEISGIITFVVVIPIIFWLGYMPKKPKET